MEDLFIKASKKKIRFESGRNGSITVEDLWELNLTALDTIAKGVNTKLKETTEDSFISTKPKGNAELELKLDILKYVIAVKIAEAEEKKQKTEKAAQIAMLKDLQAVKKLEQLQSLTPEEIEKRLAELQS